MYFRSAVIVFPAVGRLIIYTGSTQADLLPPEITVNKTFKGVQQHPALLNAILLPSFENHHG